MGINKISIMFKKPITSHPDNRKDASRTPQELVKITPSQGQRYKSINSLKRLSLEKRVPQGHLWKYFPGSRCPSTQEQL
jgi:hypothetical protein